MANTQINKQLRILHLYLILDLKVQNAVVYFLHHPGGFSGFTCGKFQQDKAELWGHLQGRDQGTIFERDVAAYICG